MLTIEQQNAIREYVTTHTLSRGLGTEEAACSIAAINLSLTGELTDNIPDCMSEVIGRWIIRVQDAMPANMRNSKEWKNLLPLAAGTGRDKEQKRHAIVMDWLWDTVLPSLQSVADTYGFGPAWKTMCTEKTARAAAHAADAAAHAAHAARAAAYAAHAADAAHAAAHAAAYAARAAAYAADAAAHAAAYAARAAPYAADAAAYAADAAAHAAAAWETFNPCGLLQKLIEAE